MARTLGRPPTGKARVTVPEAGSMVSTLFPPSEVGFMLA
jgi:hypothetical protein